MHEEDVDKIVSRTLDRLRGNQWPVAVPTDDGCAFQLTMTLREAWTVLASFPPNAAGSVPEYAGMENDLLVGADQAAAMTHPAAGLIIAEVLFDTALEPFAHLAEAHGHSALSVARVLHDVVWRRFPAGAVGYTAALRKRLFELEQDRRVSLSRELHDRVAHGIAVAMQRIELVSLGTAQSSAQASLAVAEDVLRSVLDDVRGLASDLRQHVGDGTLDEALRCYADRLSALDPSVRFSSSGTPLALAPELGEGIYLIAIEAIRNARVHSSTTIPVEVHVGWESDAVIVRVRDHGRGFDLEGAHGRKGLGLRSMQERAALLGAMLTISSERGTGTLATLRVRAEG